MGGIYHVIEAGIPLDTGKKKFLKSVLLPEEVLGQLCPKRAYLNGIT